MVRKVLEEISCSSEELIEKLMAISVRLFEPNLELDKKVSRPENLVRRKSFVDYYATRENKGDDLSEVPEMSKEGRRRRQTLRRIEGSSLCFSSDPHISLQLIETSSERVACIFFQLRCMCVEIHSNKYSIH